MWDTLYILQWNFKTRNSFFGLWNNLRHFFVNLILEIFIYLIYICLDFNFYNKNKFISGNYEIEHKKADLF